LRVSLTAENLSKKEEKCRRAIWFSSATNKGR